MTYTSQFSEGVCFRRAGVYNSDPMEYRLIRTTKEGTAQILHVQLYSNGTTKVEIYHRSHAQIGNYVRCPREEFKRVYVRAMQRLQAMARILVDTAKKEVI